MAELWNVATTAYNLPMTIMMGLTLIYWLTVIIGVMDFDVIDIDLDLDTDLDIDGGGPGFLTGLFSFGAIPFMIVLSLFILFGWTLVIIGSVLIPWSLGWLIYAPVLFLSFLATKIAAMPLNAFFKSLDGANKSVASVSSKFGVMLSSNDGERLSQCQVTTDGAPYKVNVKAYPGHHIEEGRRVLIIEKDQNENFYYVEDMDVRE